MTRSLQRLNGMAKTFEANMMPLDIPDWALDFKMDKKKDQHLLRNKKLNLSTPVKASPTDVPEPCLATPVIVDDTPEPCVGIEKMLADLTAGVESNDVDMVSAAIESGRTEAIVSQVLSRIPVSLILPLLRTLKKMVLRKSVKTTVQLFWLEQLIQSKLTFLLSMPGVVEGELKSILETLTIRIEVFDRVLKMKGRLNLLLSQVPKKSKETKKSISKSKPLIEYQDSDDDDESETDEDDDDVVEEPLQLAFKQNKNKRRKRHVDEEDELVDEDDQPVNKPHKKSKTWHEGEDEEEI